MPGIIAHYDFALSSLKNAPNHIRFSARDDFSAFKLGCFGVNVFDFASIFLNNRDLSSMLRRQKTDLLFQNLCKQAENDTSLTAYMLGFATNYICSKKARPFAVYAADEKLDMENQKLAVNTFYSNVDSVLINKIFSKNPADYPSYTLIDTNSKLCKKIGLMYKQAIWDTFAVKISDNAYPNAVKNMKMTYYLLWDKTGKREKNINQMEDMLKLEKGYFASVIIPKKSIISDPVNLAHNPWEYKGKTCTDDFYTLLNSAKSTSIAAMELIYESVKNGRALPRSFFSRNFHDE